MTDIEAALAKRLYGQTEAGNAMDAEIAHRVFGRDVLFFNTLSWAERGWIYGDIHIGSQEIPTYSTDIAAAWTIIEHLMVSADMGYTLGSGTWPDGRRYHTARFFPRDYSRAWMGDGDTLPLAICRAALAVVEVRE
jgi:hypothetical protein